MARPDAATLCTAAAAHLVVSGAGGTCTDLHLRPLAFRRAAGTVATGVVASRGLDHGRVVTRLRAHPWGAAYSR